MQTSASELEHIVRVVMQRLAAGRELMAGVAEMAQDVSDPTELALEERLVTTELIENRLEGKRTLRVVARAIVTPAVVDLLRAKKIELVRDAQSTSPRSKRAQPSVKDPRSNQQVRTGLAQRSSGTSAATGNPSSASTPPVLVCGSAIWFNSLVRHLCPKQAAVLSCDDASALQLAERHLSAGGKQIVWLSHTPFAAAATAQCDSRAVAVQLPSLAELSSALTQAQPQILIVDAPRWTVAAIGNLVRSLVRNH